MIRQPILKRHPDWRNHLTDEERERLEAIKAERLTLSREQRRIFDRARKRASRR